MRILVTGAFGMLGRRLCEECRRRGHLLLPHDLPRFQLERPEDAAALLAADHPDQVIHAAALTDVDGCEARAEEALLINGIASGVLARAAERLGARFLYISSDYVFDGRKAGAYLEDDPCAPLSAYGRSKLRGELETQAWGATVVRLSWSFGPEGRNFAATIARKLLDGESLKVVDDQRGAPTYTRDSAAAILDVAEKRAEGIYHCCNAGQTSWFGFAREITRLMGQAPERIAPCSSAEFPRPAPRPANSLLGGRRLAELRGPLPAWEDALARYLEEEGWLSPH